MSTTKNLVDAILARHQDILDTRAIVMEEGATQRAPDIIATHLEGKLLVVADEVTQGLGADLIVEALNADLWLVPLHDGEEHPMCDDDRIEKCQTHLAEHGYDAAVAVGSGTINDVVKLAAFRQGIPYICLATAPSMNGYTSGIAAVLSDGVKTTVGCQAPVAVIVDLDVMALAPQRMIQSGLGDLLSKPVSNTDWQISATLIGSHHSPQAMAIIEEGSDLLDGVAERLPLMDREAIERLSASLMLSGLAMSVAGSSSPASGGEHLISHYIDMTAHTFDLPYDFHGCQVGVGTLVAAHFYEQLQAMNPAEIDVDGLVDSLPSWSEYNQLIEQRFGPLYNAVAAHAEAAYPEPDELRQRLLYFKDHFHSTLDSARKTLRTRQSIEDELLRANAPVRFIDLGVEKERARAAIAWSKDIRNRYTILHLAWELGKIDEWTESALAVIFE